MREIKTPRQMLTKAMDWIEETGWRTMGEDKAIANQVYEAWVTWDQPILVLEVEFRFHSTDDFTDALSSSKWISVCRLMPPPLPR